MIAQAPEVALSPRLPEIDDTAAEVFRALVNHGDALLGERFVAMCAEDQAAVERLDARLRDVRDEVEVAKKRLGGGRAGDICDGGEGRIPSGRLGTGRVRWRSIGGDV